MAKWYADGLRFECQGSGNCCSSRGEYGYVYLTEEDVKVASKALRITTKRFIEDHCQYADGLLCLKDDPKSPDCIFLQNGTRCGIYEGRPVQCRTWPFWPEVMHAKKWTKHVETFCPGVGKGKLYTESEIDQIMKSQKQSDRQVVRK